MANVPVRNLGAVGIVSDINVYDLPPNALSSGVNVRFENGKITRAPMFRRVHQFTDGDFQPAHILSIPPISSGIESLIVVGHDYSQILSVTGSTATDITPETINVDVTDIPFTHCYLGGVVYVNRGTNVPLSLSAADTTFVDLPAWDPDWRCRILRSYKDNLIALNVTKGANVYPSMVKWSDFATFGSPPADWDETSTTNSAGENILNGMAGQIIDGCELRDSFFIYGENEVWVMSFVGGTFVYDFRKRFSDRGIINANCVVEVDGLHYVFDRNDIYVHDGSTSRSIIHGSNKDFVFDALVKSLAHRCFVHHDPKLNEIHFNYVSDDVLVGFPGATTGCNRSAVYNYRRQNWTFYDLPNVTSAVLAAVVQGQTYEDAGDASFRNMGGTYLGDADESEKYSLYSSRADTALGLTASRIYGFTPVSGGRLAKPIEEEANRDAFVERIGIDLDENGPSLTSYKSLLCFYPQLGLSEPSDIAKFQFGSSDVTGQQPDWDTPQQFDPTVDNKLDVRVAGRYLGYRLFFQGLSDFTFSGFDARLTVRGNR